MEREPERSRRRLDLRGHVDVGLGGRGVARGVVVHQDQRRGVQLQRPLDHLARVDRDVVHGAPRLLLVGDQHVLAVEEQDAELLLLAVRHDGVAVVEELRPRSDTTCRRSTRARAIGARRLPRS